jgi:hypothetical protein
MAPFLLIIVAMMMLRVRDYVKDVGSARKESSTRTRTSGKGEGRPLPAGDAGLED